jgi:zinc protease
MLSRNFCPQNVHKTLVSFLVVFSLSILSACKSPDDAKLALPKPEQNEAMELTIDKLPIDEKILKGSLENGLQYIIRENKTPENFAELRLVVKTGSIDEDDSQRGFAHFAEHMAFNGTKDFKEQEIIAFVESIGMKFGAHLNATTTFDNTIYKLRVPTDKPEVIERAIHVLENWAHKISFDALAIDEERGVVLEEWRSRKGVGERIAKQQWPIMFAGTNYAQRLPIGTENIITKGEHKDLVRFYTTWYRPDLMSVVAVGDFESANVEQLIKQYFGEIKRPAQAVTQPLQYLSVFDKPAIKVITDDELRSITLSSSWRNETELGKYTKKKYKQRIIKNLLSGVLSKRINDQALNTESPFLGARISSNQSLPTAEEFYFRASIKPKRTAEAFEALLTELKRAVDNGVSKQELETEKRLYIEWFESALASQNTLTHGVYLRSYINHFLQGAPLTSLEQDFTLTKELIETISLGDLKQQMKLWAGHQNAVVFLTAPTNMLEDLPSEEDLMEIWKQTNKKQTKALIDKVQITGLMDKTPSPGKVIEKNYIDQWQAHQWILSNGVKVILKPTSFKENSIRFKAISNGGYSLVDDETYLSSFGMMDTLSFMGLGNLNMEQFAQFSREKRFSVNPAISNYSESMSGASNKEDLIYMMQGIYLRFTAPVKDPARFEWLKDNYRPQLENKYNSPNAQFYAAIQAKTKAGNPRNVEFDVGMLEKQNLDTIFSLYEQRFANAADFTFVFVGDMDLVSMEDYVSTYLANLPANESRESRVKLPPYALVGDYQIHMEKGTEPKATVISRLNGDASWSYQNQLVMGAFKSALEKELRNKLREELAGVYSVSVSARLNRWPHENYSVSISFTCDPRRVDELTSAMNAIFAKFIEGNIEQQQLDNYKTQLKTSRHKNLLENWFWLDYILYQHTPFVPMPVNEHDALVDSLTLEMVKQAAKQYLSTNNRVYATLKPEIVE